MHTALMALTSYEANDIVANSRRNPLEAWRRLQKRYDPTTGGRKRNLFSSGTSSGDRTMGSCVSRCQKTLKDKSDDEVSLAGLEALVLEETRETLDTQLKSLANVRGCVTCVEAKFGWRIRDSMPSDTGSRAHCDPTDADAVNSLSSGKRKRVIEST